MTTTDKIQFDNLLVQLAEQGASDLYLSVGGQPMLKVGEQLVPASQEILTAVKIEELVFPLIDDTQKDLLNKEKSLVFGHTFENKLRFKINLFYQKGSLAASLRLIEDGVRSIQELGLPSQINEIINLEEGLVVVAGPINSGKSTTMAAIVEYLNTNKQLRIVTLEKPIEKIYTNKKSIIQQREIGKDAPSFKEGLEDCFEASLDVVVISQVENKIGAEKILELAQQGYLVLVITSANSALDVILRFLSFFDGEEQDRTRAILSQVLKAIICQKLVVDKQGSYRLVPEILFNNDAVRLSIENNKLNQIDNIIKTSFSQGMVSFEQSLSNLVQQGEITQEEARKHMENNEGIRRIIEE